MRSLFLWLVLAITAGCGPAAAGPWEFGVYTGYQRAGSSRVTGIDPGGVGAFLFSTEWDGQSFEMPPYLGLRLVYWHSAREGFALEFTHAKIAADGAAAAANGFSRLEFTNGLNTLTANYTRRWPGAGRWVPYGGAGVGLSVPHVRVTSAGGATSGYQLAGPAVTLYGGAARPISDRMMIFGEYKGTYTANRVDLDNGGALEADVTTHALNVGVSVRF